MIKKGDFVSLGSAFRAIVTGSPRTVETFDEFGYGGEFVGMVPVVIVHARNDADSRYVGFKKLVRLNTVRKLEVQ